MNIRETLLIVAASFSLIAVCLSSWLIRQHQNNMTNFSVQSKIVGIIWMIPIYSVDSFLSLLLPSATLYIDMLRDCYEAYVLYLFLSLMLSYLNSGSEEALGIEESETSDYSNLILHLTNKEPAPRLPFPFSFFYSEELPKGEEFLRFCKFGTMQYCTIRPLTTLLAILLDRLGLYNEASFSAHSGWLYITVIVNISIAFAFAALFTFYTTLKKELAPFEPVGKFLCIKFVIFVAFWQSVVIAVMVRVGAIHDIDGYTSHNLSRSLQDFLICFEMFLVSFAHLYTFSYKPFTEGGKMEKRSSAFKDRDSLSLKGPLIPFPASFSTEQVKEKHSQQTHKNKKVTEKLVDKGRGKVGGVAALYVPPNQTKDSGPRFATGKRAGRGQGQRPLAEATATATATATASTSLASGADRLHLNTLKGQRHEGQRGSSTLMGILDRNFASNAAVRDFNESMPIIVPSNFSPENGTVAVSRPSDRVTE